MSTECHLQTDGQAEVMNHTIEDYIRISCNYSQQDWDLHVTSAEFAYGSSIFEATGLPPFYLYLGSVDSLRRCSLLIIHPAKANCTTVYNAQQ